VKAEDCTRILGEWILKKFGIEIDRSQIRACHRLRSFTVGGSKKEVIVAMCTSTIMGSFYDKCLFRPNNWNGEKVNGQAVDLELSRMTSRGLDARTKAALLYIRRIDKSKPVESRRVKKVDVFHGVPCFWDGRMERKKVLHPDIAFAMMTEDEKVAFASTPGMRDRDNEPNTQQGIHHAEEISPEDVAQMLD
jgi:hypothetical protein